MGAGESKVQGHSQLHNELEGNRGFAGRRGEEEKGEEEEKRRGREGDGRREGGEGDGGRIQLLTTGWTSDFPENVTAE